MQQLQLVAYGEPSDVIELNRVPEPALGQEDVLVSMEAAPINPSDFMLVRGIYHVRPAFPFPVGAEGVGRVIQTGSKVDGALRGRRVLILPTYEQGTWADQVVVPARNVVPMSDDADPLQLSMVGVNPATAYLLLNRYASLMPGDWIGQTAANSAMGQYILKLAKLAGVKTLNIVRRKRLQSKYGVWEVTASSSKATTWPRISRRLSMGKNLAWSLTHWAEALWASWASRSRGAARLSSTPWTVGKSQPSRPSTSSPLVLAFTDSGSAIGCATHPAQTSRKFTRSWATS